MVNRYRASTELLETDVLRAMRAIIDDGFEPSDAMREWFVVLRDTWEIARRVNREDRDRDAETAPSFGYGFTPPQAEV
ncbi:MAG: hypothetical protein SXV54_24310 [Chloroflexota bacterium]|nr:hypothetical protein [Chloroflexota bacterium]